MLKKEGLDTGIEITWCPGCGNFGVLMAVKKAIMRLEKDLSKVVFVWDIGCAGNGGNFLKVSGVTALHGRTIPLAVGIKMAGPDLTVVAQAGEGGLLNEGMNHLIHAAQRNDRITVLLNNNFVFGLTTGQASAGTPLGLKTRSTPEGNPDRPLSAIDLALVAGASFVGRTRALEVEKTADILYQAMEYNKGLALVEVIQPCKIWVHDWREEEGIWLDKPVNDWREILGKQNLFGVLFKK